MHDSSYFHHLYDTGWHHLDPTQALCCMVVEPTLRIEMLAHCLYVSIKHLMNVNHLKDLEFQWHECSELRQTSQAKSHIGS